ncbi:LAQU0S03e04522g1_1 [Lachancea quebecensis]|uniref:LAQU0S03e04522g1_1 n=1 Tax=Lachancea quebecensis TaxID=1654605 RepID=A0A0N7ML78_9SACH|nr:LAQU0S03e04522g1_1 [Lachancea quebecensis]
MANSLLSLYSDSWTLSERPGSNLIKFDAPASDSGSSMILDRSNAIEGSIGSVSPQQLRRFTTDLDIQRVGDLSVLSMAQRSLEILRRVEESMHADNVFLTEMMVMHKPAWDVDVYSQTKSEFPLENVPIKCNILKTLFELLRDYQESKPELPLENVAKVLHYLNKLIQASQLEVPAPQSLAPQPLAQMSLPTQPLRKTRTGVSSRSSHVGGHDSHSSNLVREAPIYNSRVSMHSGSGKSRIFSKFFTPARSRESMHTRSTITVQPVNNMTATTNTNSIVTTNSGSLTSGASESEPSAPDQVLISHKLQDLESMKTYKECIVALAKTLRSLPQTDQNTIIFHFVDKSIVPFILKDCKLLLMHYLHEEVILKL